MPSFKATVDSRGRVTIPAAIRRQLEIEAGDVVRFLIDSSGKVMVRRLKYPNLDSLAGAAGRLNQPLDFDAMREIARDDALTDVYDRDPQKCGE